DDTAPITFSLVGADAALLAIDAASGVVTLIDGALDFDAGVKTSYVFDVVATDSATALNSATLAVTVTVTDDVTDNPVPDTTAPVLTSAATANAVENQNVLYTAGATDDTAPITFSLAGADAALLAIDAASGVVTLAAGNLDFDAGVKTSYAFDVIATDGATPANASAPLAVTVTVTDDVTDNGPTVENVTAGNTTPIDAAADEFYFVFAAGTYTYNITGFGLDDVLDLPDAFFATATVPNTKGGDGNMTIMGNNGANVITIELTGIEPTLDTAFSVASFNAETAFGAGSLI
ncbi:hypothetical protein, partial [Chromatium okenii]|uniref:hypothetical protein n=1 Tax=Chromatium okenii TaxID=61644 RepID=UPI0026EE9A8E